MTAKIYEFPIRHWSNIYPVGHRRPACEHDLFELSKGEPSTDELVAAFMYEVHRFSRELESYINNNKDGLYE